MTFGALDVWLGANWKGRAGVADWCWNEGLGLGCDDVSGCDDVAGCDDVVGCGDVAGCDDVDGCDDVEGCEGGGGGVHCVGCEGGLEEGPEVRDWRGWGVCGGVWIGGEGDGGCGADGGTGGMFAA